ncbi:MAG: hypothetical protein R2788_05415 [Saprospiraceae bacterium]
MLNHDQQTFQRPIGNCFSLPLAAQNVGIGKNTTHQNTLDVSGGLSVVGYSRHLHGIYQWGYF